MKRPRFATLGIGESGRIHARVARGWLERLVGLVAQPLPARGEGLWLEPCSAVHTFGVRGHIDLVFVSRHMIVRRVDAGVAPRRLRIATGCRSVLELRAGEAARAGLRRNVQLHWCKTLPKEPP